MPRMSESRLQDRLERIILLLRRNRDGLTEQEIAERLNYERRTTNNYLRELEMQGWLYKDGQYWILLPSDRLVLRPIELKPEEAMVLYLAARLFVKQSDKRNEAAELMLERLAEILTSDVGLEQDLYEAARALSRRPQQPDYENVFRTVMRGYLYRRKVQIVYHPYRGKSFETVFSPYLLEPSGIGFATYAIGYSSLVNALRTYKVERIEEASLTRDEYEVPADFPGLQLLNNAWSIFYGDTTTRVVLRFHPDVVRRVQETNWHPSQQIEWDEELPGYLRLAVEVADTTDLTPWIRGWGANCEVLEPASLRRDLSREVRRMAEMYAISPSRKPTTMELLWAKTHKTTGEVHLLIYHLIDVASVALAMWEHVLGDGLRQQIAGWLRLDTEPAGRLIAFWAGLHDLGKASPVFQAKYEPVIRSLQGAGLKFPPRGPREAPHGLISAWALEKLLAEHNGLEKHLAKRIARALGGHHGAWPIPEELLDIRTADHGDSGWDAIRAELVQSLRTLIQPPARVSLELSIEDENAFLTVLSGLTSVADWVGSMDEYFLYEAEPMELQVYASLAAQRARQALQQTGWIGWSSSGQVLTFEQLFPAFTPNMIQQHVIDEADSLNPPALAILEAPTGIGKTETALYLADRWIQAAGGRGIYVAMPTQATSNQMFDRVRDFLAGRYPEGMVNLQLLHSQAQWTETLQSMTLSTMGENEEARVAALGWFLPRKRGLLAPFAVGTVDQALVSILLTKHFFVRLFGLGHKVVIFDEVHAYDTYMSTLFCRLLQWLRQLGASVIVLSATLPSKVRQELLEAYLGEPVELPKEQYPTLTVATPATVRSLSLPAPANRHIALEWLGHDPRAIADRLADELQAGGCAVVICNTVKRAQEVYQAINTAGIVPSDDLILFHARFPFRWRQKIEQSVLDKFSKDGGRPRKAILVATQVVEQSLDLDFDLMISDLAPIDLLIQRAGRLHRHPHHQRPARLATPRLLLTQPAISDGLPSFGADAHVYAPYILLSTWLALQGRSVLTLPDDTVPLIEAVYGEPRVDPLLPQSVQQELDSDWQELQRAQLEARSTANDRLVRPPSHDDLLAQRNSSLEEEDPSVHQAFQAMTRLIAPGVTIICLFDTPKGAALDPQGSQLVNLEKAPPPSQIGQILQNTVTIHDRRILNTLLQEPLPPTWQSVAALRHHRVAIFRDGICRVGDYVMHLSDSLGLEVDKEVI